MGGHVPGVLKITSPPPPGFSAPCMPPFSLPSALPSPPSQPAVRELKDRPRHRQASPTALYAISEASLVRAIIESEYFKLKPVTSHDLLIHWLNFVNIAHDKAILSFIILQEVFKLSSPYQRRKYCPLSLSVLSKF